jgi:hypothetical protein
MIIILRLNRKSIHDLPTRTYLTDTRQATGYSCISHPFSWVISQLVARRDWFRLIRILPYSVARLNRYHWCVVFCTPTRPPSRPVPSRPGMLRARWYPVPIHTDRTHIPDYTIRTKFRPVCAPYETQFRISPVLYCTLDFFTGWSVGRLVGWSVGRLVGWSVGRLVGWSVGRWL